MISHLLSSSEDHQCSALTMHPKRLFYIIDQLFLDRYGSDVFYIICIEFCIIFFSFYNCKTVCTLYFYMVLFLPGFILVWFYIFLCFIFKIFIFARFFIFVRFIL